MTSINVYLRDDSGAAAVEYSIILAFIAATLVLGLAALGGQIADVMTKLSTAFSS